MPDVNVTDSNGIDRVLIGNIGTDDAPDYGIKITAPDGTTTIIDGTSDVFKIVASGTLASAGGTGPLTIIQSVNVTVGVNYPLAFFGWIDLGAAIAFETPSIGYSASGHITVIRRLDTRVLDTVTNTVTATHDIVGAVTDGACTFRWYLVMETAL